jgi:DNA invertase Pin-like site-specific DNA recombinase
MFNALIKPLVVPENQPASNQNLFDSDVELKDFFEPYTLDKRFIADLVLQILSYTAQKERENTRSRQMQGIKAARAKGKHLGRPKAEFPAEWEKYYKLWTDGIITATKAMEKLNLKKTTFYKLVKRYVANNELTQ